VDDGDFDAVARFRWHALPGHNTFYAKRNVPRPGGTQTTIRLHTFLTGWTLVDHKNNDGLDNRRHNLRPASVQENRRNSRKRTGTRSGFAGVSFRKGRGLWVARIGDAPNSIKHLGYFASEVEAARAYDTAARELFGEFARPNFALQEATQ
jgi:hypothetical protein